MSQRSFLQISLAENDRNFLRVLWCKDYQKDELVTSGIAEWYLEFSVTLFVGIYNIAPLEPSTQRNEGYCR
jgi:hypothetical protein